MMFILFLIALQRVLEHRYNLFVEPSATLTNPAELWHAAITYRFSWSMHCQHRTTQLLHSHSFQTDRRQLICSSSSSPHVEAGVCGCPGQASPAPLQRLARGRRGQSQLSLYASRLSGALSPRQLCPPIQDLPESLLFALPKGSFTHTGVAGKLYWPLLSKDCAACLI